MVNHYYVYLLDRDFGPLFIKFCSYFPYAAKLCLNGHEWLKRQLTQRGIAYEPLDNGIRADRGARAGSNGSPTRSTREDRRRLPQVAPPPAASLHGRPPRRRLSLSALDPPGGIRVDPGPRSPAHRPRLLRRSHARESRPRPARSDAADFQSPRHAADARPFRTRVLTEGVVPSLHVDYKTIAVKQYHKEGQALRTETTINDTYDFEIGRALRNLPALREIGFAANRRLLRVESLSHDCLIGDDHLDAVTQPVVVDHQRAAGLRFGDRRVLALMQALCLVCASAHRLSPSRRPRSRRATPRRAIPITYPAGADDLRPASARGCTASSNACRTPIAIASPQRRPRRDALRPPLRPRPASRRVAAARRIAPEPSAPSTASTPRSPNSWRRSDLPPEKLDSKTHTSRSQDS